MTKFVHGCHLLLMQDNRDSHNVDLVINISLHLLLYLPLHSLKHLLLNILQFCGIHSGSAAKR